VSAELIGLQKADTFKRRQARQLTHSDNPKTVRNREWESAKTGFDAAVLKAKTALRQLKHRRLKALRLSKSYLASGEPDREQQEIECMAGLEEEHVKRMDELEAEWNRKLEESDIDEDECKDEAMSECDEGQDNIDGEEEWHGINDEEEWKGIPDDEDAPFDEEVRNTLASTFQDRMNSWAALIARLQKEGEDSLDM
jgi:hypothetical protein